jgi:predicted Zn-dependent peptidase
VLTAAGNFDPIKLETQLEQLPARPLFDNSAGNNPPQFTSGSFFRKADFQQSQLFVCHPLLVSPKEEWYYHWSVFNAIAGDTMSSRLFQRLREQSGYCYSVYSFFQLFRDTGFWGTYAASSSKNIQQVLTEMQEELTALFDKGITEREIDDARSHLCGEELLSSEDMENRMKRLARQYLAGQKLHTVEESVEHIRSVSSTKLITCIHSSIDRSREAAVLYGSSVKNWAVSKN